MRCLIYLRTTDHWSANQGPLPNVCSVHFAMYVHILIVWPEHT